MRARAAPPGPPPIHPPFDLLLAAADQVAATRPEVDLEMAREVFGEVATLLHDGLVLDGMDDHDARAVVEGLCLDLVSADPGTAVRARSEAATASPGDLHEPDVVAAALLMAAGLMQL